MRGTIIAKSVAIGAATACLKYSPISPIKSEKSLQIHRDITMLSYRSLRRWASGGC